MLTVIVGVACLALGLYAGKKRAFGKSWTETVRDLCIDVAHGAARAWKSISYPFRKGECAEGDR